MKRITTLLLLFIVSILMSSQALAQEFQTLFNGKDLSGWKGKSEFWTVKDGAIFGRRARKSRPREIRFWFGKAEMSLILYSKRKFVSGGNNSGVQYRSELVGKPEDFVVKGYQADLHPKAEYFGMLYAEKWRGIVAQRFQRNCRFRWQTSGGRRGWR